MADILLKPLLPDADEWREVVAVGVFECEVVGGGGGAGFGFEVDTGEIEPAQEFPQNEADGASVEIAEWVDGEEASLGEGEEFQRAGTGCGGGILPARGEVAAVVAHEDWHLMRERRVQIADADFDAAPASGPLGHEVGADARVQIEEEIVGQFAGLECAGVNGCLDGNDAVGEQGRELRVA